MDNLDAEDKQLEPPAAQLPIDNDTVFDQLWSANQAALTEGDYETACHSLEAALARAYYRHDVAQVTAVGRQAAEQHKRLFEQASDVSKPLRPDLHPARQDAIRLVYTSIVQQIPARVDLLQRDS